MPGRIVGLIGRNAVGKTRYLASLGSDLAQISRRSAEALEAREARFPGGRPLFTRIIAISYSAFDRFKRPPMDSSSSYVYCGIRNDRGGLSRSALIDRYRLNQVRIRERGEQRSWMRHMKTILGDQGAQLTASLEEEIRSDSTDDSALSSLSSGQSILAHFVTALLAWISPTLWCCSTNQRRIYIPTQLQACSWCCLRFCRNSTPMPLSPRTRPWLSRKFLPSEFSCFGAKEM